MGEKVMSDYAIESNGGVYAVVKRLEADLAKAKGTQCSWAQEGQVECDPLAGANMQIAKLKASNEQLVEIARKAINGLGNGPVRRELLEKLSRVRE